jgi:hypothetical protein
MLVFFVSCSKKDGNVDPETGSCKYAGVSYVFESRHYSLKTSGTYDKNVIQTDDRLPLEIKTSIRTTEKDTVQNTLIKDDAEEDEFLYKYDSDGHLIQEIFKQNRNQQGGPTTRFFFLDKGPVQKLQINSTRTTDFKYENGSLKEVSVTDIVTYIGNDLPAITKTYNINRKYGYDAQNNLTSVDELNQDNYKTLTNYAGGLITSTQTTGPDGKSSKSTYKYENGRKSQVSSEDYAINFKYDANGNLLKYESVYKGQTSAMQEYQYDDYINPETLVASKFKGMPLPFYTVQSREGKNNVKQLKNTSYSNGVPFVSEENTTFTYNNAKLPQSSITTMNTAGGKSVQKATFKYTDCK